MHAPAIRCKQSRVGHLANPLVREIETFADDVQNPAADQLFDALGGLGGSQLRRPLEEREVEFAADHTGHAGQAPSAVAEPIEAGRDDFTNTRRREQIARNRFGLTPLQRLRDLDDHERVAFARAPHSLGEPLHGGFVGARPDQRLHERHRLRLRQRTQRRGEEARLVTELRQRPTQDRCVEHLLDAHGADHQYRQVGDAPTQEHEMSSAQ